jgi:hypothetical protein
VRCQTVAEGERGRDWAAGRVAAGRVAWEGKAAWARSEGPSGSVARHWDCTALRPCLAHRPAIRHSAHSAGWGASGRGCGGVAWVAFQAR